MSKLDKCLLGAMLLASSCAHAGSIGVEYGRAGVEVGAIPTGNPIVTQTPRFDDNVRKLGITGSANFGPVPVLLSLFRTDDAEVFSGFLHPDDPPPGIRASFYTLETRGARLTAR